MSSPNSKRTFAIACVAAILFGGAGVGMYFIREKAKSPGNLFSLDYWKAKSKGGDMYNAEERFLRRGNRAHKTVLLTFDDGPHPKSASTLLDTLKREHVRATFFVVGMRVKQHPELVKRMIDEGHEVGNHTQDHIRLITLPEDKVAKEIELCDTNVFRASGRHMTLLRPPGMRFNEAVLKEVHSHGYTMIGWNIGAKDFIPSGSVSDMTVKEAAEKLKCTPELVVERVMKQLKNGTIILLHDNPVTVAAIPELIKQIKARGYIFQSTKEFMADLPNPVDITANPTSTTVALK